MSRNAFGLSQNVLDQLKDIFIKYDDVKQVILYGSRALGTFNERSDIDLVIKDSTKNRHLVGRILMDINESNIPFLVDLQILENLKNPQLIDHILRIGKVIYSKSDHLVDHSIK